MSDPFVVVKYSLGATINLGNFNSARIDVGVEMPCEPGKEKSTYRHAREFVVSRLEIEKEKISNGSF